MRDWYQECLWTGAYSYCNHYPGDPIFAQAQKEHDIFPTFKSDQQRKVYNFIHSTHY